MSVYDKRVVPQDLRTVDPRPIDRWDDEKAKRVAAIRVEIRFGPASEVAAMLGLLPDTRPVRHTPVGLGLTTREVVAAGGRRVGKRFVYDCTECGEAKTINLRSWTGIRVCKSCRAVTHG